MIITSSCGVPTFSANDSGLGDQMNLGKFWDPRNAGNTFRTHIKENIKGGLGDSLLDYQQKEDAEGGAERFTQQLARLA